MRLGYDDLSKHMYVIGGTGVGKSRAIEAWVMQHVQGRQGVGVIDPHGELYDNLVARIAALGERVYERVVLINPLDPEHIVGINPLELKSGEVAERRAQFLASVVTKIFRADPIITARMQRMMFHAFWLLVISSLTLVEFEALLTDEDFRATLLQPLSNRHNLRRYWEREFPTADRLVTEWTQSSLNKVGALVADPDFALMLGQQKSTVDFRAIMDEGKVLLVRLSKGELSEQGSHLMGAFVLAQIQLAALSRAAQAHQNHRRFTLFLDEFQNYTTDDVHEILAESRKYKLSLVVAHQFYEQLHHSPELQAAVLNTVGNLVSFQVGDSDAEQLARDIFAPPVDAIKDIRRRRVPTGIDWWPFTTEEEPVWRPLPEIWELERRKLTQLPPRMFWYRRRGEAAPQLLRTVTMPDVKRSPRLEQAIGQLMMVSAAAHARSKAEVAAELAARQDRVFGAEDDAIEELEAID